MIDADLAGTELGGYRLESRLGQGGMGQVYLGHHILGGWKAAIKVMRQEYSRDEQFRHRFFDEARLARSLDDPRVVTIHDLGEDEGRLFIAMEHMEGGDLAGLLRREGPLDPARTLKLLEPVAKALDAAHAQRLVHGDVKPANILLDDRGDAHVSDLGLAQAPSSRTEVAGQPTFRGTPDYAAPEQIRGESWDPRTDVYALGGVLYECLIGDTPFGDAEGVAVLYAHIEKPAPLPSEANPALAPFDRIIRKALAKEPDDRFQSCATMFVEMRAAASPPPAPTQIAPSAAPAPTRVAPPAPPKPPPTPRIPEVPAFKTPGPTAPPAPEPSWIPTQMRQLLAGGAALSALVLFISLFLSWFEAGGAFSASAASDAGVDITTNAWQTFTGFEAVFVLAALSAVVLAALLMFAPREQLLLTVALVAGALAGAGFLLAASKLISPPDLIGFVALQIGGVPEGFNAEGDPQPGIFLALLASGACIACSAMVIGAYLRTRRSGYSATG